MNLADDSRIWIFQANRKFSSEEKEVIILKLKKFIADWNAHGASLLADFDLPYDQFIVVGVDEKQASASGCSIDKLTKIIRELDAEYNFEFLNRMLIAFEQEESIKIEKLPSFKSNIKEGLYNDIKVFNNGISNLAEFKSIWVLPIEKSWAKSLLN
ncbi:ABC transporter ATPase [Faecalibacter macacae]|uniref:ABC transporter ATPase n=1 Tax=Faecalibacter macacae TaxID=1859289 RepID=A0A3L9MHH2_9FLAO|nr:ABC transporter ATPase [Faecalibacter macacae]RLZ12347.1 ABC transporter ATPase [Faecalibacter macacae]